ncbi:MAG TPA: DUF4384 domain-containing protein [Pyrinomonadaceae bacterium]|jgi:hypothetical protein|nr:DUF4384 domain-containing protein [Pyrinomonadaceae bacterium]
MKLRLVIFATIVLALSCGVYIASAQQSDDEVRGMFIGSRPKTTNPNPPPRRRHQPPRNANTSVVAKNQNDSRNTNTKNANTSVANRNSNNARSQAIALGYTMFMRDVNGRPVRIDPNREFHNGDRIRISLEPNIDGYLYVFHTEGDGPPEMIFPDARLEAGENWVEAHVPMDVPSTLETDERLKWFQFYGNPATEHVFVVLTREPLADVPIAETLTARCTANKSECQWHPTAEVWTRIQQAAKADVKIVTSNTSGQAQTEKEETAATRGLGLDQSAPQPSVIRMSASTSAPVLVTTLDLVHK